MTRGQTRRGGTAKRNQKTKRKSKREPTPDPNSREILRRAAGLVAGGMFQREAAEELGISPRALSKLRMKYRKLFDADLLAAGSNTTGRYAWSTERARPRIRRAMAMKAGGATREQIDRAMDLAANTIEHWRKLYPEICREEYDRAVEVAGILLNGDSEATPIDSRTMRCVCQVFKRERQDETEQTPKLSGDLTLSQFYYSYVEPKVLKPEGAAQGTLKEYHGSIEYWRLATGNPPLKEIDAEHCQEFVNFLRELPSKHGGKLAVATIRKHSAAVQRCLNLAGPPIGRHTENRDLYGYVRKQGPNGEPVLERKPVPYIKRPRKQWKPPRPAFSDRQYEALLSACRLATRPEIDGIPPADFWRSLFVWINNVGTRIETTTLLTWDMLDGQVLNVPAAILKEKNDGQFWVNRAALEAVNKIRSRDCRLFSYRGCFNTLGRQRIKLMAHAGIVQPGLGFHGLRRRLGARLAGRNPLAAQKQLGHKSLSTTDIHYVPLEAVAEAFEELGDEYESSV